ncbi:uncharacterized protein LOC106177851 [Lingula anatina]|uniref:Uncharacterized protein LOC106177851 n=1 Tax=Lingula anatina TaxID=7574 RepID=A0A1S3K105_LINAN|nr:uncharacterized protein LOC106177851 [Lingula anatina]|eukprot:XP_013416212.1 uncharacterized protein LOC106177851 [Lingula anatina]
MLPQSILTQEKDTVQPEAAMTSHNNPSNKKYVIAAVSVVTVIALAVTGTLLAVHFTQRATVDLMKAYHVTYKDRNTEFNQQVEISTTDKLEALHSLPSDGQSETFVLHDYNVKKTALRFSDDKSCYIRDMPEKMKTQDLANDEKRFQNSEANGGKISGVKEGYFQAVHVTVDESTLSDAILDFCSGLKLQLLVLTTKEKIAETSNGPKPRQRRGLFDQFQNFADKKLNSLNTALNANDNEAGGDVGVASVGGGRRGGGLGVVPISDPYGPGPVGPGPKPKPVGPVAPVGPVPKKPKNVGCFDQSACKVKEGCTVRTDRVCVDYGWFFGNRGGVGRKGQVSDPACLKWEYNDVKDCVIVNNCEQICT